MSAKRERERKGRNMGEREGIWCHVRREIRGRVSWSWPFTSLYTYIYIYTYTYLFIQGRLNDSITDRNRTWWCRNTSTFQVCIQSVFPSFVVVTIHLEPLDLTVQLEKRLIEFRYNDVNNKNFKNFTHLFEYIFDYFSILLLFFYSNEARRREREKINSPCSQRKRKWERGRGEKRRFGRKARGKDEGKMCFGAEWLSARRRSGESLLRETKRKAKSARGREAGEREGCSFADRWIVRLSAKNTQSRGYVRLKNWNTRTLFFHRSPVLPLWYRLPIII